MAVDKNDYLDSLHYIKMEQMRELEQKMRMLEKMATEKMQPKTSVRPSSKASLKDSLEKRKIEYEKYLKEIEVSLTELEKITLKPGDAAFHPKHGNVVIRNFHIGDEYSMEISSEMNKRIIAFVYDVEGGHNVLASELLPISDATKVLYDRNQS